MKIGKSVFGYTCNLVSLNADDCDLIMFSDHPGDRIQLAYLAEETLLLEMAPTVDCTQAETLNILWSWKR